MRQDALFIATIALSLLLASCAEKTSDSAREDSREQAAAVDVDVTTSEEFALEKTDFRSYWFAGLAELTRFDLKQSRYGEIREGEAVNIFVTEPFLPGKQVKHEFGDAEDIQVLKLNHYRRFYTGVYPYNLMTSTFTPAFEDDATIKLTTTVQEWCGQVFAQLNKRDEGGWDAKSFSYFQAEGDQELEIGDVLLEDEVMTMIRKDPESVPTGEIEVLPAMHYLRFMHEETRPYDATASLSDPKATEFAESPLRVYTLDWPELGRITRIYFQPEHPYRIEGWEELYPGLGGGSGGERARTVARRTKSIMLDYWSKNDNSDSVYREALGLQF